MKKLLNLILAVIICTVAAAQYPVTQNIGSPTTLVQVPANGGFRALYVVNSFTDTTAANTNYIKNYSNAIVATTSDSSLWLRSLGANAWIKIAGSSPYSPSGNFWSITGNYMSVVPSNFGLGTNSPDALPFRTDATTRVILPSTGLGYQNDTSSFKPMVFNTSTKTWGYGSWFGGGGGGGGSYSLSADSLTGWALSFDYLKGQNVNHGRFWPYTDSFYRFFNEAWVVPDSASGGWTGYYVSAGYGGDHAFLGGMESGSNGWSLTGNVYTGTGLLADATWTGYDVLPNNTLHHVAVGYDGAQIVCYIDGVPSGKKAFTGYRKGPNGSDPIWFTGGSDHNNFNGKILRIRHFEDDLPIPLGYWFYPKWTFDGAEPNTVLNVDYTSPANVIDDMSMGFWGVKHPGVRNSIAPGEKPFAGIQNSVNTAIDGRPDSLLPQWVKYRFTKPTYTGGSPSIPGSAVIYDSYSREDVVPAWTISPVLDSTEGGTAGKKKYNYFSNSGAGILNTQAWLYRSGGSSNYLYVDAGVSDQDIRVTQTIGDKSAFVVGRFTDNNNQIYVQRSGTTMYINKVVASVTTTLDTYTTTGTYTELKLVLSGGNWTVYEDGVSKKTGASIGDVPLGTKCGWGVADFYARVKKFEVY